MNSFSTKHPLLFCIILFIVALLVAGIISAVAGMVGLASELGTVVGRILVAVVFIALFSSCFHWEKSFSGLTLAWPVLIVVAWNIAFHLMSGCEFISAGALPGAVLLGFAPGLFEEVLFRGIIIGKLRESGRGDRYALWASAILFALAHLTNVGGMNIASLLVQVGYSLVIGLLFGAIYLKNGDIATVILAHALVDISNQIFTTSPSESSIPMIIAFVVVLVAEGAYALWLSSGLSRGSEA